MDIVPSYDPVQFKGKQMNQTWENGEKPSFEPDFGQFVPNQGPQIFFLGFTRRQTLSQAINVCNFKENV